MAPIAHLPALAVVFAALTAAPALAAPADVRVAPGRVVYATDASVQHNVDAGGGGFSVALPDRSVLIAGGTGYGGLGGAITITKLGPAGAPDTTFGDGGSVGVPVKLNLLQMLRRPDGRLLLVGADQLAGLPGGGPPALKVVQLLADGTVDQSFGDHGTATTGVGVGCGACTTAALAADGSVVLTGATGTFPTNPTPTTVPDLHWALTRLTPSGTVDSSFGSQGVATVPGVNASGFNVAVAAGGAIVSEAQTSGLNTATIVLARLTPSGAMDPAFNGGQPVTTRLFSGFPMLLRADGSVLIAGSERGDATPPFTPGKRFVVAYTATGAADATFGTNGAVDLGTTQEVQQLLPSAGGGVIVVGTPLYSLAPGQQVDPTTMYVSRWGAGGPSAGATPMPLVVPFGGGGSSFVVSRMPRPLPPLGQNSFTGHQLTPRSDGGFLAIGGISVRQPTGEGVGFSIGRTAIAAYTPDLAPDPAWGGALRAVSARVSVVAQRAHTAHDRHGIRIRLVVTSPGLMRVKIRTRDGRHVLAQSVLPVFGTTARTLPVELTRTGNRWLRTRRNLRVAVTATARDLFGQTTTATARGTVR